MPIPLQVLPSFLFYCYVSAITPGPANICSLSTSLTQGKKAALQQWTGIFTGFFADSMIAVFITYFLGTALNDKVLYLCFVGAAYLVYLAVHILLQNRTENEANEQNTDDAKTQDDSNLPSQKFSRRFFRGVFVQLTNVKVILMCFTALTSFVLPYNQDFLSLLLVGLFLPFTGPVANMLWILAGLSLQRLFSKHAKVVSIVMSASLLLCAASLVISFFTAGQTH